MLYRLKQTNFIYMFQICVCRRGFSWEWAANLLWTFNPAMLPSVIDPSAAPCLGEVRSCTHKHLFLESFRIFFTKERTFCNFNKFNPTYLIIHTHSTGFNIFHNLCYLSCNIIFQLYSFLLNCQNCCLDST